MDNIGPRLRAERERLGFTQDALIERASISKGALINYEKGKRSPDAELLAALAVVGFDVTYILTGVRQKPLDEPTERERDLLAARGIAWGSAQVEITPLGLCWLLNFRAQEGHGKPLLWGRSLLAALTEFAPKHPLRSLRLQAVSLHARDKAWPTLTMYLDASPPAVPWALSPRVGVSERYDFALGEHDLPIELPDSGFSDPVLLIDIKEVKALLAGKVLSYGGSDPAQVPAVLAEGASPSELKRTREGYKAKVSRSFFSFAVGKVER